MKLTMDVELPLSGTSLQSTTSIHVPAKRFIFFRRMKLFTLLRNADPAGKACISYDTSPLPLLRAAKGAIVYCHGGFPGNRDEQQVFCATPNDR